MTSQRRLRRIWTDVNTGRRSIPQPYSYARTYTILLGGWQCELAHLLQHALTIKTQATLRGQATSLGC